MFHGSVRWESISPIKLKIAVEILRLFNELDDVLEGIIISRLTDFGKGIRIIDPLELQLISFDAMENILRWNGFTDIIKTCVAIVEDSGIIRTKSSEINTKLTKRLIGYWFTNLWSLIKNLHNQHSQKSILV